jgi:hypothetical protein
VYLLSDPEHCGRCDVACPGFEPCLGGVCGCAYPEQVACRRGCTLLEVDEHNCGACDRACEAGSECVVGECTCRAAATLDPPIAALTALDPGCVAGAAETWQPACFAAIHQYCAALDCFDSGVGPLSPRPFMPVPPFTCVRADVRSTTFAELAAIEPACTGLDVVTEAACVAAIHRTCVAAGRVSGFGPVEVTPTGLQISCVRDAAVVHATFADLQIGWSECDSTTTRGGRLCALAAANHCRSLGHESGFGPVALMGDEVDVVCLDP